MEIEYDNSKVRWCYNGSNIEYYTNGIEFATYNMNAIYIEVNYENVYEYHYVSLQGKLILSYCENTENITIMNENNNKKIIHIPFLHDVALGCNKRFFVLAGENFNGRLLAYTCQGEKINEYLPPSGYTFYRFGQVGNEVNVICQGNENTRDKYGRNDWSFKLNMDAGEWEKLSLAY